MEFLRFLLSGFLSVFLNFSVYFFLNYISGLIILPAMIGYTVGLTNSYFLGKFWVYKSRTGYSINEVITFLLVYAFGALSMIVLISVSNDVLRLGHVMSWCVGSTFAILSNFFGSKVLVFKKGGL
jgi:putative flippase GtrA